MGVRFETLAKLGRGGSLRAVLRPGFGRISPGGGCLGSDTTAGRRPLGRQNAVIRHRRKCCCRRGLWRPSRGGRRPQGADGKARARQMPRRKTSSGQGPRSAPHPSRPARVLTYPLPPLHQICGIAPLPVLASRDQAPGLRRLGYCWAWWVDQVSLDPAVCWLRLWAFYAFVCGRSFSVAFIEPLLNVLNCPVLIDGCRR